MALTVHLCALLLLLCCSTSCLGNQYEFCLSNTSTCLGNQYEFCLSNTSTCGDVEFGYPFGINGSGCGDPEFQLEACDYESHTLINIGGNEYHILESSFLANSSTYKVLTIVNDNLWGDRCNLSSDYSQFWRSGSHFHVLDTYTNLTLWKHCHQGPENVSESPANSSINLCGDDWYYSLSPQLNLEGKSFCNVFQLPIKQNFSDQQTIDNKTLKAQGFEVSWQVDQNREQSCDACLKSNGNCGYKISKPAMFLCHCRDGTSHPDKCPKNGSQDRRGRDMSTIIIGCSLGVALTAIALVLLLLLYAKRRNPPPGSSTSNVEKFLKQYAHEMPTRFSHSHLKKITNNFAEKLGEGGYGVVYKGKLPSGALVAVKILDRQRHAEIQFMNEVATIGWVHHFNLVRLSGYCFESITSALVYEYMVNGSLEKFIFTEKDEEQVLTWEQLYSIALGAAHGIAYLHKDCEKRIIHFDIKPHNILLDADFTPKVADFGLAKLCGREEDHISMTAGRGTPGYVAPELCSGEMGPVTDKSDVYSFGMLLLEIVGGRKNIDSRVSRSSQFFFPEWAFNLLQSEELGRRLRRGGEVGMETGDEQKARTLAKVGLWCIQYKPRDRPCMSRVVQMLEGNGYDVPNPPPCFNPHLHLKYLYCFPWKDLVQFRLNVCYLLFHPLRGKIAPDFFSTEVS